MTLDAPEAHTTHELLELVADVLDTISLLASSEVPGMLLDTSVQGGPFDFGALYQPDQSGSLAFVRGSGFPDELNESVAQAFGALDRLEGCRRSGKPLVLMSEDTRAGRSGGIEEALGAECALAIPLLDVAEECPVLLLAAILHDVTGTGEGLCRSLQAAYKFARSRDRNPKPGRSTPRRWERLIQIVDQALLFSDANGLIVDSNVATRDLLAARPDQLTGKRIDDLFPGFSIHRETWVGIAVPAGQETLVKVCTTALPKDDHGLDLYLHTLAPAEVAPRALDISPVPSRKSTNDFLDKKAFEDELTREIELGRKYDVWCSVLVIDLDGLSALRQVHGDGANTVMREIGEALHNRLRRSDRLGRLGRDGFGVLLSRGNREQALALGTSLLELVKRRSTALGHPVTASIGVSYFPDDGESAASLVETAFGAMMLAKRGGGDNTVLWGSDRTKSRRSRSSHARPESNVEQAPGSARSAPASPRPARRPGVLPPFERVSGSLPPLRQESEGEAVELNHLVVCLPEDPSGEFG